MAIITGAVLIVSGVCAFLGIIDLAAAARTMTERFKVPFPESLIENFARFIGVVTAAVGVFFIGGALFAW